MQKNVVPAEISIGVDYRVTVSNKDAIDAQIENWCQECDVELSFEQVRF